MAAAQVYGSVNGNAPRWHDADDWNGYRANNIPTEKMPPPAGSAGSGAPAGSGSGYSGGGSGSGSGGGTQEQTGYNLDAWKGLNFHDRQAIKQYYAYTQGFARWSDFVTARAGNHTPTQYYGSKQNARNAIAGLREKWESPEQKAWLKPHLTALGNPDPDAVRTAAVDAGYDDTGNDQTRTGEAIGQRTGERNEETARNIINPLSQGLQLQLPEYNLLAPAQVAANPYLAEAQAGMRSGTPQVQDIFGEFMRNRGVLSQLDPTFNPGGGIVVGGAPQTSRPQVQPFGGIASPYGEQLAPAPPGAANQRPPAGAFGPGGMYNQRQPGVRDMAVQAQTTDYGNHKAASGGAGTAAVGAAATGLGAVAGGLLGGPLGAMAGGYLGSLVNIFTGNDAERSRLLTAHLNRLRSQNTAANIQLNWDSFGADYNAMQREWQIRGSKLGIDQSIDKAQWNSEDWFRDNQFRKTQAMQARSFDMSQWRTQALGRLGDVKSRFDTNIGNMFRSQSNQNAINTLWTRTTLEGRTADMQHLIGRNLTAAVGQVSDRLTDTKASLSDYMYNKNQQIEDQLYEASLELGKSAATKDMMRVVDGWREKVKMEKRASEKLFRGNQLQEKAFKDKVAQKQYQAQMLMSGGSRGSVDMADPVRANRITAMAELHGAAYMAAERMDRIDAIGSALDTVENQVQDDPGSWNQSKKILAYFMDRLDTQ